MAITIDPGTRNIIVQQSDLTFISGTLYAHDTDAFRHQVNEMMDDEAYVWLPDWVRRFPPVTVAGTTFAQTLEMINGFSIEYDDTPGPYSVRLEGSNNNFFDVEAGVLVQNTVSVISTNSAGLLVGGVDTAAIIRAVEDWGVLNFSK